MRPVLLRQGEPGTPQYFGKKRMISLVRKFIVFHRTAGPFDLVRQSDTAI